MAKPPVPPVRLPRLPGSLKLQPPLEPAALTTLQPAGAAEAESNVSVVPMRWTA